MGGNPEGFDPLIFLGKKVDELQKSVSVLTHSSRLRQVKRCIITFLIKWSFEATFSAESQKRLLSQFWKCEFLAQNVFLTYLSRNICYYLE